jgi:membrane protein DedA with SNARE-associated domain
MVRAVKKIYLHFGLPGAGLIFLLEGIGAPIPVEIPLGVIGLRVAEGVNSYWQMVMLMWLTTVVGNSIGYMIGYFGGRPMALKLLSWFRIKAETWDNVERWFNQHGLKLVIATRWINWGFAQNMWLCGITRIPFRRFFTIMVINNLLWAMGWTWLAVHAMTYLSRGQGFRLLHEKTVEVAVTAILLAALSLFVWWLVRKRGQSPNEPQ